MAISRSERIYSAVILLVVAGIVIAILFPAVSPIRGPSSRTQCANNLKQIGLALISYEGVYGELPPAIVRDAQGRPMHSWRVLILPFVEEQNLYDQYDFSKPWNHPDNLALSETMPLVYRCPNDESDDADITTNYVAVVGDETIWPPLGGLILGNVRDGMSNTILVMESESSRTHWMAPSDLSYEHIVPVGESERTLMLKKIHHSDICMSVFADGSVRPLNIDTKASTIRALCTIQGNENVGDDEY